MAQDLFKGISVLFSSYEKPDGSLDISTHALKDGCYDKLLNYLTEKLPFCYITRNNIKKIAKRANMSPCDVVLNKYPDKGSVMAGDFGEISCLYFLACQQPKEAKRIMKWRYKQDRQKAAPHSDVIILYCKEPNSPSIDDYVICAEAKLKSTKSEFNPISKALEGYSLDKTGRLARTLTWLHEKAIENENEEKIEYFKRVVETNLNVSFDKYHKAVAIVDMKFIDNELIQDLEIPANCDEFECIVLGIPNLKSLYESVYERSAEEVECE